MRPWVLLLPAAALACDGTTPPERPEPYDYAIRLESGPILTFRWPATSLPVRFWIEPGADLHHFVRAAIREWESAALYGEFSGIIVNDAASADVRVRIGESFAAPPTSTLNCGGSTSIAVERDTTIALPFVLSLFRRVGVSDGDVLACFAFTVTHEMGHTLGLFLHSDDPQDLMFARPSVATLSPRDRATFGTLYHSPVSVGLPPGR